ncbi:MAG: hypothetical protein ABW133_21960, partial [Polyangiaceae bacterium]
MNGRMIASTLTALGLLFQAACGAAPESDTRASGAGGGHGDTGEIGEIGDLLSQPYVEDAAETALRIERAAMPAAAGGPDRLFRGDFLFASQMLQDPTCNWTLQMGNP